MTESKKKKQTGARKNSKGKTAAKGRAESVSPYQDEIVLVVTLVASILMLLSFFNLCGVVGRGVNFFLFGSLGAMAYLLPFLLFFGIAFAISNRGLFTAKIKIVSSTALFIVLCAMLELLTNGYDKTYAFFNAYARSAKSHKGGGMVGSAISRGLCYLFGEFGTYVVLVGAVLILFMLITEKFLFAGLRQKRLRNVKRREERRTEERKSKSQRENEEPLSFKIEREPAKVYTFPKDGKAEKKRVSGEEKLIIPEEPDTLDLENLSIFRGYEKKMQDPEQELPIYEEELKSKFKNETKASEEPYIEENPNGEIAAEEELPPVREDESFLDIHKEADPPAGTKPPLKESPKEAESEAAPEIPITVAEIPAASNKKEKAKPPAADNSQAVGDEIGQAMKKKRQAYVHPPLKLLNLPKGGKKGMSDAELKNTAAKLKTTLDSFGVRVEMKNVSCGPAVTRYELQPAQGVKVSRITSLTDDIKLSLAAADIRIEAPIPGKSAVGIEVPNREVSMVYLRELLESREFKDHPSNIAFAVGKDIGGKTVVTDIAKMPHLLIAGATGSGKSVCINTLIMSILYKADPEDVKLIMVDPKVVELSVYNGIPHLLIPVVTDPKKASGALNWAVVEMTDRYKRFADLGVRDIKGYNARVSVVEGDSDERFQKMPQIVIIVDELADLMMVAPGEVEDAICRLAQLARAAGIHLIIATQRPSVNVITGLIKANVPSRVAFAVSSAVDSRTILDGGGAEKLLGNGDMLFFPSGFPKPIRVQGSYVSDKEVSAVVDFLKEQFGDTEYSEEIDNKIQASTVSDSGQAGGGNDRDEYFAEAGKFIIEKEKASIGMLQRVYKIGFNRAARIMDQLYDAGVVGPEEGTKPRKVLMSLEEFEQYMEES